MLKMKSITLNLMSSYMKLIDYENNFFILSLFLIIIYPLLMSSIN